MIARARPRGWEGPRRVLGFALLTAACGSEGDRVSADAESEAHAQVEAASVRAATEQEVVLQTRQLVPIRVTGHFGSGCEGVLVPNAHAERDGRLQVHFASYLVKLTANGLPYDSRNCVLELRVSGARGYRYAIQSVLFVGGEVLLGEGSQATFASSVWWSGRRPLPSETDPVVRRGPLPIGNWRHTQDFVLEDGRESGCFASDDDWDEVTLHTSLALYNPDPREPAEFSLVSLVSEASVVVEIEAHRCS